MDKLDDLLSASVCLWLNPKTIRVILSVMYFDHFILLLSNAVGVSRPAAP